MEHLDYVVVRRLTKYATSIQSERKREERKRKKRWRVRESRGEKIREIIRKRENSEDSIVFNPKFFDFLY